MSEKFRIGALNGIVNQPLFYKFHSSSESSGELLFGSAPSHAEKLLNKELDAAFLNPIDYALNSSDLLLHPLIAVSSSGFSGVVRLYLRKELKAISSLAVNATSAAEVVLAKIILAEKYDSEPSIVPVAGTIDAMLAKADSALVVGDDIFAIQTDFPFIDLVDEWNDITELPYVHTVCAVQNGNVKKEIFELLKESRDWGIKNSAAISYEHSEKLHRAADDLTEYLSHFSYSFTEDVRASLDEFFRLAYYYGMLPDVPDINIADA